MKELTEVIVSRDSEESQGKVAFFECNRYRCLNSPPFYVRITLIHDLFEIPLWLWEYSNTRCENFHCP
jgi:hypothetical protein